MKVFRNWEIIKQILKVIFFIFFLFFGIFSGFSQEQDSLSVSEEIQIDKTKDLKPLSFNREKIEELKQDEAFNYLQAQEKESWWSRFKSWVNAKLNDFLSWMFGDYSPGGIVAIIISVLPFLLLLGFFALVIWLFSRLNPGRKILKSPANSEVFISEEEELIKGEDLPQLMKEAVKNGNFRLAVRYYYLNELRKMDELKIIDYQYQKTNHEYFGEIEDQALKTEFILITRFYEFIWYGSFKVSEEDFRIAEKEFQKIEHTLQTFRR